MPGAGRRRQRPGNAAAAADGMKLHRRTVRLGGGRDLRGLRGLRDLTVISPRPGTAARFSTNRFHETWHVLSDPRGAMFLARLLWGLSYQSRPGTVVVLDRPFLVPTPFDADPADPIVLVPSWHTPFGPGAARALARRLPLRGAPEGTVRWRSHGLDGPLEDARAWLNREPWRPSEDEGLVERMNGLIVLRPQTRREMREWAVQCGRLARSGRDMDYAQIGRWIGRHYCGEVQVFRSFHRDVSVARRARADVLARGDAPEDPERFRMRVWRQRGSIGRGRARLVGNCGAFDRADSERLAAVGIATLDDLVCFGAVGAHRRLRDARVPGVTDDLLWAMDAFLTGTAVTPARAEALRAEPARKAPSWPAMTWR
ncbi:TfoX/Sxy family DNA transformation protein [Actinomadura litoris]|uniref:TfoX/Sxy family DNA transformation protein n=1 Tax=Actinomadura litoris TaxID=2678616 RepID=UPI001FA802ED|nr:TfoX/Sxy family DNA transformation protein [Actinomadura litoris]